MDFAISFPAKLVQTYITYCQPNVPSNSLFLSFAIFDGESKEIFNTHFLSFLCLDMVFGDDNLEMNHYIGL